MCENCERLALELAAVQAQCWKWLQFAVEGDLAHKYWCQSTHDTGLPCDCGLDELKAQDVDSHAALNAALEKAKQGAEGKAAQAEARREQAYQQLSNLCGQQCELCSHFRSMVVQRDEALDKLAEARREGAEAALEPFRPLLVACGAGRSIGVPGVQTAAVVAAWDELADFFAKRKGAISRWADRCREIAAGIRALPLKKDAP